MKKFILFLSVIGAIVSMEASAQTMRTAYFMENTTFRNAMNPAFSPYRGYFNIPTLGSLSATYSSNAFSIDNIFYKNPNGDGLVTFMDESVDANTFIAKLKADNKLDTEVNLNLFGFGFYSGKAFWSFGIDLKTSVNIGLPKGLFEFMKLGSGLEGDQYNLKDMRINTSNHVDIGLGYSRPINDRLTVGGKLKFIGGLVDMDIRYTKMDIKMTNDQWLISTVGDFNASISGIESKTKIENGKEIIDTDGIDITPKGLSGMGFGVDLGATYRLLYNLTLSTALIDLGYISWDKKSNLHGVSSASYEFAGFEITDDSDKSYKIGDFDELAEFEKQAAIKRTSRLRTTLNIGAEYAVLNNLLGFGLLSSTQFRAVNTFSELTASACVRPASWFSLAVSYSLLNSDFKTFGLALNFSPSWINLFVGTDYMVTNVSPQFIPINQRVANVYFGLAIPLGKRPTM